MFCSDIKKAIEIKLGGFPFLLICNITPHWKSERGVSRTGTLLPSLPTRQIDRGYSALSQLSDVAGRDTPIDGGIFFRDSAWLKPFDITSAQRH
jgi:hypothetical protein